MGAIEGPPRAKAEVTGPLPSTWPQESVPAGLTSFFPEPHAPTQHSAPRAQAVSQSLDVV